VWLDTEKRRAILVVAQGRANDGGERHFSLVDDLVALADELAIGRYSLVILDPINSYLGTNLDTHRDAALRSALTPLAKLAEAWGVAVVFVGHLNKSSRDRAIYRANGGIGYIGASRVVHLVGLNPENERERAVVCIKNNLAPIPPALGFEIQEGQFHWLGETDITAGALLSPDATNEERSGRSEATEFLRDALSEGPVEPHIIQAQARQCGISDKVLRGAREALGIKGTRVGGVGDKGKWFWQLPNSPNLPSTNIGQVSGNGHVSGLAKYAVEELGLEIRHV
jgi:hypothetical protein